MKARVYKGKVRPKQGQGIIKRGSKQGQGKAKSRKGRGQGKAKVKSTSQYSHNLNRNYNLMGFDTIEINLVLSTILTNLIIIFLKYICSQLLYTTFVPNFMHYFS